MTDTASEHGESGTETLTVRGSDVARRYEPPTLVLVGNARDLLAGRTGSAPDSNPIVSPSQPGS